MEIGVYQIAEAAGVPAASVYHFFPTKEAAFIALAQRYADQLFEVHRAPIEACLIRNWTDLFEIDARRAMEFYNANVPALTIFYGGHAGVETREIDRVTTSSMSKLAYGRLDKIFHMPFLSHPEIKFTARMNILDAIWSMSVRQEGYIAEDYHQEAISACHAYSQSFLPGRLEKREFLIDAAKNGERISLAFDAEDPAS